MLAWKTIKQKDLNLLQAHHIRYGSYSDFSAVNLWGFMAPKARWAQHGDTVIYELFDYHTGDKYYSILGNKDAEQALAQLMEELGNQPVVLRHVPRKTLRAIAGWQGVKDYSEDHDNHDYIFAVNNLTKLNSLKLLKRRKSLAALKASHSIKTKRLNHHSPQVREQMYTVFKTWVHERHAENWQTEFKALKRALMLESAKLDCIGAFDGSELIGFTVNEAEPKGYYQGHFGKADYNYKGIGLLLEQETAKYMRKHYRSTHLNLQQDLGIEGIRYYKNSLGPIKKLKKYTVNLQPVISTSKVKRQLSKSGRLFKRKLVAPA